MLVRILKNSPEELDWLDISPYAGLIFSAERIKGKTNNISVDFGKLGILTVCEGEYEIIEEEGG